MASSSQKKWFVYLTDHHEGPFLPAEIEQMLSEGRISPSHFLWCDGMPDWQQMNQIPEFGGTPAPVSQAPTDHAPTVLNMEENPVDDLQISKMAPEDLTGGDQPMEVVENPDYHEQSTQSSEDAPLVISAAVSNFRSEVDSDPDASALDLSERKTAAEYFHGVGQRTGGTGRALRSLLLLLLVGGGVAAYLQGYLDPVLQSPAVKAGLKTTQDFAHPKLVWVSEKIPFLQEFISPIPYLDDVSPEEYKRLQGAASSDLKSEGPAVAVALSTAEPAFPHFYVASNLPEGVQFEVFVDGIPGTLLNRVRFSAKATLHRSGRLGKTEPIRAENGAPIPRGEYTAYVYEAQELPPDVQQAIAAPGVRLPANLPQNKKLVVKQVYFLGGEKNAAYTARLREFQKKVQEKGRTELGELKQLISTLEMQLGSTMREYGKLSRTRQSRAQLNAWARFHDSWMRLSSQMGQLLTANTPEEFREKFYYGVLYTQAQQAFEKVSTVHGNHYSLLQGKDIGSLKIQTGEVASSAEALLQTLKTQVERAEAVFLQNGGIPVLPEQSVAAAKPGASS